MRGVCMECENCLNEHRLESAENAIKELREKYSAEHKEFYTRIENLEKENAVVKNDIEYIKTTVDEMNNNVKILMAVPGKRYDTIVVAAITTIVGTLLGFLASMII